MRIGLLECDHVADHLRHIAGDYRDMFALWLGPSVAPANLASYDVCNGERPASPDACDAYVCTGSRQSVNDDLDWIHWLRGFIGQLHEDGTPFVGICFGHQLLAAALGGQAVRAPDGWGVGVHRIDVVRQEAWMRPPRATCRLLFTHQDQVERLPAGSVVLGRSGHCSLAMFQVGATMLGIQAHPELAPAYVEALMLERAERIGAERIRTATASLQEATDEETMAAWVLEFLMGARTARRDADGRPRRPAHPANCC